MSANDKFLSSDFYFYFYFLYWEDMKIWHRMLLRVHNNLH